SPSNGPRSPEAHLLLRRPPTEAYRRDRAGGHQGHSHVVRPLYARHAHWTVLYHGTRGDQPARQPTPGTSGGKLAHAPELIILEGLQNLRPVVHHECAGANHR